MTNVVEVRECMVSVSTSRAADTKLENRRAVGWYARDVNGRYTENEKVVQYLVLPPSFNVNFDLTLSHPQDETKTAGGHVDHIFKWIMMHSRDANGNPKRPNETFISARAYIGRILRSPYDGENGWNLFAARVHGVIYLYMDKLIKTNRGELVVNSFFDTDGSDIVATLRLDDDDISQLLRGVNAGTVLENKKLKKREPPTQAADVFYNPRLSSFGRKFEQYLLADTPGGKPDPTKPAHRYEDMVVVMRASLGRHRLLYMGEVDGLPNQAALSDLENTQFVELKTVNQNVNPNTFKRYKLLQYWAQCVTSNCDRVLIGHRDDVRGVVRRLEEIDTDMIPGRAEGLWSPKVCYGFLGDVLDLVEKSVNNAPEDTVFQFQWRPTAQHVVRAARLPSSNAKAWIIPRFYREWLDSIPN